METSRVAVEELTASRPPSSLASTRHNSSTSSQLASTRHSCEAPTSPHCPIHSNTTTAASPSPNPSATLPPHTNTNPFTNTTQSHYKSAADASRAAAGGVDPIPPYKDKGMGMDGMGRKLSVDEQRQERRKDYSRWLTRMMGRQLVKGLNGKGK
ncbi:hypothetical protein K458DRAFT_191394 [Lentithecium fluviatile CBS 122367]|uniref:Uncharacterized protein n=1 Tax=Lentithecium fluviatile CBS 122367 TaxID=1168545 RepID=A0A6G1JBA0_9PLEO|nr:hypothetical protein K458DRAFT_191394 [Lentithecium fluviatile CBS 122367]